MKILKPFIKLLKINNQFYVFDGNTSNIIEINQNLYDYFDALLNDRSLITLNQKDQDTIQNMIQAGLLHDQGEIEIEHILTEHLDNILNNELSHICLQTTQNCNLRCKYCVFSGSYINRVHTKKRMDWNTAKKALDFLHEHNGQSDNDIIIGFFGGEPLLEIELIKKSVAYSHELFSGKNLQFNITTNATLLDFDVAKYLLDNNFTISLSIDGPQEIHDLNRVYVNGQGSFEAVMNNIQTIFDKIPNLPTDKFLISTVLSNDTDLESVVRYFKEDSRVNKFTYQLASVNDISLKSQPLPACENNKIISQYENFKMFLYGLGRIPICMTSQLAKSYVNQLTTNFYNRMIFDMRIKKAHPGGPCIPGQHKLFVDVDGNLYPCERVSETSPIMRMGSLDDGIDISVAKKILNVGQVTKSECSGCWAFNYCTQCIAYADGETEISREKRLHECDRVKKNAEEMMKDYIVLQMYGCEFEKFENVKI